MDYKIIPCMEGDEEFVAGKINAFTDSKINFEDAIEDELVVFKVVGDDEEIIAGCNLIVSGYKNADLDILWVDERFRRQGIGSALIREAERAAIKRGCLSMTLGTFDFQARPLYERFGFSVCGVIDDCPSEGHVHYDMIKPLDDTIGESADGALRPFRIEAGDEEDAEYIDDKLVEYNLSIVPSAHGFKEIGGKIADEDGNLIAACYAGVNFWNIAFIGALWVDEPLRFRKIGSRLLADVERKAKEEGADIVLIDARDWNADFFKKCGYTVYCTINDLPKGYCKYKLLKRL